MFRAWMKRRSTNAMLTEVDQYLRFLHASSDEEIAMILISSALTREILLTSKRVKGRFPTEALTGTAMVDEPTRAELLLYSMELGALQTQCHAAGDNPAAAMAASGAVVWRLSVRAVAVSELFAPGREMWMELLRGQPHVGQAFEDMQEVGVIGPRNVPEVWTPAALVRGS